MPFNGDDGKDESLSEADPVMFEDSKCECRNSLTYWTNRTRTDYWKNDMLLLLVRKILRTGERGIR